MRPLAIIPTFVRAQLDVELVSATLRTLHETAAEDVDVLVVDDGSPAQDLVDRVARLNARWPFELVRRSTNEGFSRTVNVGLRRALEEGRDAILVNADIEFIDRGWVGVMQRQSCLYSEGPASVVGARLLFPNGLIQHGGVYFSLLTRTFDHLYKYGPHDLPEALVPAVRPVTGALQLIRHECLTSVGLYDEGFCSPANELVSTALDGPVPIAQLDRERHGLVTVDHSAAGGRILRGRRGNRWRPAGGRAFDVGARPYAGDLRCLQTASGDVARLTPRHRLRVHWTEKALRSWVVYLMRRGRDWRLGICAMRYGREGASGPALRWSENQADALWVLAMCETREEALLRELSWSLDYRVPTPLFRERDSAKQHWLDEFWAGRDSVTGALALLRALRRDPGAALIDRSRPAGRGSARYVGGSYHGFLTAAANVMGDGYMAVSVDPGHGVRQARREVGVDVERFEGDVYSLEVPPYHYYVSGGVVVHNSLGYEDVDYCLRTMLTNRECVYQPGVRAVHHESLIRGRDPSEKVITWTRESFARLMHKYARQSFAGLVPTL